MTTTFCRDYDRFDPDAYLQMFYSSISGHVEESCEKDLLMLLHEIFSSENIKGKQLLEIGTGPTIHSVISASRYFENIYLSDFQLSNREFLLKWWNGTNTHDFSPFFRFIKELEADGQSWKDRETELRKKVQAILRSDLREDNPLSPSTFRSFDAVLSCLCLSCVASDAEEYKRLVKRVASLVKFGGWLILIDVLEQTFYRIGEEVFGTAYMKADEVKRAIRESGMEIKTWKLVAERSTVQGEVSDFRSVYVMAGVKLE